MEKTATFLLRLPQELKKKLEIRAKEQNRSVNSMIQTMIEDELGLTDKPVTSLEHRQFIGQVISSKQIDQSNGLVQVNGIFYRYLIESNLDFNSDKSYIVIEANGNILTLRPVEL
ncbi:hypothetical protein FC19_GL000301 [Liquorilactobacillus aquaticus DSM 21051]|uniref:Arc-like DNA binding domain-containing protein n=1 Tax=Liquorilactobacillus aquaticus DSM 21051 TaxID=1423725 RepID=A0A0R2CXU9_9LACO|nr:Arc family DNA-binding protein [Liquorilactobacillus aquaticus]KRM96782.1 hypothetical protein FC19_GL000301 [Liquorilactobacillus aquaticus DSM 21051]